MKRIYVVYIALLLIVITGIVTADSASSILDSTTTFSFTANSPNGHVMGSENIMLYGAGSCGPFTSNSLSSSFCNIIEAGSTYDLTVGSVTTTANEKYIQTGAALNYEINVKPYGTPLVQIPAMGSTEAYIKAHIQGGNTINNSISNKVTYSETTSAHGIISGFNKKIQWQFS